MVKIATNHTNCQHTLPW